MPVVPHDTSSQPTYLPTALMETRGDVYLKLGESSCFPATELAPSAKQGASHNTAWK